MKRARSYLEMTFKMILKSHLAEGIPAPVEEFQFAAPGRLWRFDFAFIPGYKSGMSRDQMVTLLMGNDLNGLTAVELEGGLFIHGGHSRGMAHIRDMDKFNEAAARGWKVLRFSGEHLSDPKACLELLRRCLGVSA